MTTAVAVAAASKAPLVHLLPLGDIRQSPSNPRKTFADLDTLAEDLRLRGVLQPVLVRPVGESYELVFGERRWRAAKLAKLETIPAFVRELGDQEALELQIVENAKRADIHPVEEAEAYRELHEKHKLSVDEIAAKVGKSKAHVYGRIKLCELAEPVKKAALAGELPATHALLIARIPSAKLQAEALRQVIEGEYGDGAMSYRDAESFVHQRYMLRLADVGWDMKDEQLVPAAGSCTKCPKRTGNQPELFADVKAKDVCTDTVCFESKKEAFVALTLKKAQESGQKVMPVAEAKKAVKEAQRYDGAYVDLDATTWEGGEQTTWRKLLGKKAPEPVLAPADGEVKQLVARADVEKAIGHAKKVQERRSEDVKWKKEAEKHERQRERARAVTAAITAAVVQRAEKTPQLSAYEWRFIAWLAADAAQELGVGVIDEIFKARGWIEDETLLGGDKLLAEICKLTMEQARGVLVEMLLTAAPAPYGEGPSDTLKEAAKAFGVNYDKVAAEATGKPPATKKVKAKKSAKKAKKK